MPFGQVVIGPPGSGKSTYCNGLQQFFKALDRPIHIVNLDPANDRLPYECSVNIVDLISLSDVMQEFGLGPNGAMIYCLEYLETNFDWLEEQLAPLGGQTEVDGESRQSLPSYVVFDMPGQVELSTNHDSLRNIVAKLGKAGYRLAAVNLTDAFHVTSASTYISILLLSLRTMLQLELPHLNVLSKIDLITSYGDLPFNLDYYTEVQDLTYLQYELQKDPRARIGKFMDLNRAICDVVEDFGLVGFSTLCVEDKMSMAALVKQVDQILGCVPVIGGSHKHSHGEPHNHQQDASTTKTANELLHSLPASAFPSVSDVQDRYVDYKSQHAEHEKDRWTAEADKLFAERSETERQEAVRKAAAEVQAEKSERVGPS